jgi:hypothetical protein
MTEAQAPRGASTRGVRNHNPGNIEHDPATKWQGLADPPTDGRFCRFRAPAWGIRAIARVLITYQDRHGIRTIAGAVARWAPEHGRQRNENDTAAYIRAVARATGFDPRQALDFHTHAHLRPVVEAIIAHECDGWRYPAAVVDEAMTLAGVPPATAAVALRSGTAVAATGTAAVAVGSTAIVEVIQAAAPGLPAVADLARAVGPWVVALLVVLAAGWFVWQRTRRAAAL